MRLNAIGIRQKAFEPARQIQPFGIAGRNLPRKIDAHRPAVPFHAGRAHKGQHRRLRRDEVTLHKRLHLVRMGKQCLRRLPDDDLKDTKLRNLGEQALFQTLLRLHAEQLFRTQKKHIAAAASAICHFFQGNGQLAASRRKLPAQFPAQLHRTEPQCGPPVFAVFPDLIHRFSPSVSAVIRRAAIPAIPPQRLGAIPPPALCARAFPS